MKRIQYHVTLVVAGAVLFLTAACVSSSGPQINCPPYTLEFGGTDYTGERVDADAVRLGRALEDAS